MRNIINQIKDSKILLVAVGFLFGGLLTYFFMGHQATPVQQSDEMAMEEMYSAMDPFERMKKMSEHMDKMFEDRVGFQDAGTTNFFSNDLKITEREDDKYKYIDIEGEGFEKDGIKIDIQDGMVNISGEIRKTTDENNRRSSYISKFSRAFNIPEGVDATKAEFDKTEKKITIKFPRALI